MSFLSQSSDVLNSLSADSLSTSLAPLHTAGSSLAPAVSGLSDPLSSGSLVSSGSASSSPAALNVATISQTLMTDGIFFPTIPTDLIFGTPGGSTLETATDLGRLNGTQSLFDLFGVTSSSPNDYYRITLTEGSNFNLSMTGLTADADVQFLNSLGEEIARSTDGGSNDEAINLDGLAAGDYYIRVYRYNGDTGFSLDLSSTGFSNLLPRETDLGTVGSTETIQTGFISDANTADVYHFSVDGYYRAGDLSRYFNSSNLSLSLTGLTADADVRIIRDVNQNGLLDPGEQIVHSTRSGTASETIELRGLGVGSYFAQVYQYAGETSYTLSLSAQGGEGFSAGADDTASQAYNLNTLNGHRIFAGSVSGRDPEPWTFQGPRDMNDYYRFDLDAASSFNLSLTGLNGDADVRLLDATGSIIDWSTNSSTTAESITRSLAAGTYYVQVYPFLSNSTGYTLTLNATPT
jgi:hypothetical protein